MWTNWFNLVLGVWLVIAPFVLGYSNKPAALWNDIILGLAVGVLAYIGATSSRKA